MTLSDGDFWGIWGVLLTVHLAMFIPYWNKWKAYQAETADRIRKFNARQGYGQGVGKERLARAYTMPFQTEALTEFAEINGITPNLYREELRNGIGRRVLPLVTVCWQAVATLIAIFGLIYLVTSGPVSRETYLLILGALFLLSVVTYPLT